MSGAARLGRASIVLVGVGLAVALAARPRAAEPRTTLRASTPATLTPTAAVIPASALK